jgi:hypothetical protein
VRVPPATGQVLVIVGLAACLFGVVMPRADAASAAEARVTLAESQAYVTRRVEDYARDNQLSLNHSSLVNEYRQDLERDLDLRALRREAAAAAGAGRLTSLAIGVTLGGLVALAAGALLLVLATGHVTWVVVAALALIAGGVARAPWADLGAGYVPSGVVIGAGGGISDERLCRHVGDVIFTGDQAQLREEMGEQFMQSCLEAMQTRPISQEARRCLLRARTQEEMVTCQEAEEKRALEQ